MPDTTTKSGAATPAPVPAFDQTLLDPTTWKEPVEYIPIEITKSELAWSDEKYNAATEFRPALPRPIAQWKFELSRLDAKYALLDGSEAPVIIYAGVDLETFKKNSQTKQYELGTIMKGRGKPQTVVQGWTAKVGNIASDPGRLVGQKWRIAYYRSKQVGNSADFAMQNVALPHQPLTPDYKFEGDVRVFEQKRKDDGAEGGEQASASAFGGGEAKDPSAAASEIAAFIRANGIETLDSTVLGNPAFPTGCRIEPFVSAFVAGDERARDVLAEFGEEV